MMTIKKMDNINVFVDSDGNMLGNAFEPTLEALLDGEDDFLEYAAGPEIRMLKQLNMRGALKGVI